MTPRVSIGNTRTGSVTQPAFLIPPRCTPMLTSSSAAQFAPSSSATPTRTAVDAAPDAPSTSLGARTVTPVPVQQPVRDLKSGSSAAEAHFAALPRELLEIIAADASDTLEEAQAVLGTLALVQQVDDKVARTWAFDPVSQKRMEKENPRLGPLGQLLHSFSYERAMRNMQGFGLSFDDVREDLWYQAQQMGYSVQEAVEWLASPDTLIQLIGKHRSWLREIPHIESSEAVALHFVAMGDPLNFVPEPLRSYRVCLEATGGPRASWGAITHVPAHHRTSELICAAVSRHPEAVKFLAPEERTLDLYELAGALTDFETFSDLPVTRQVAADPRYRAVFERLQAQAHPGVGAS